MLQFFFNLNVLITLIIKLIRYDILTPLIFLRKNAALLYLFKIGYLLRNRNFERLSWGERLAKCLIELGPSYIKFGQTLATRSDLIGEEAAKALAQLQDKLEPFDFSHAKIIIENELGLPVGDLFSSFEKDPIAAASIAQVHNAITPAGEEVAVKILRPNIKESFERDIRFFLWLAKTLEHWLPETRRLHPIKIIDVFSDTVELEMDLRMEASAASELADNFINDPNFKVPKIDWKRTSQSVLTLERINGFRPDDREAILKMGLEPRDILEKSASIFFNQVFRDGFFHADMHPGNVFIQADGKVAPVDFGIMGRLDIETRFFLADMLMGFLTKDYRQVAEVHFRAGYVPADQSVEIFTQACRSIGEPILDLPLKEISLAKLLSQLFRITAQFKMEMQPQLLLLQKTMLVAEGVGRQLDPSINIWELTRPLIERWLIENKSPTAIMQRTASDLWQLSERISTIVKNTEVVIGQLSKEGLKLDAATIQKLQPQNRMKDAKFVWPIFWIIFLALVFSVYFS